MTTFLLILLTASSYAATTASIRAIQARSVNVPASGFANYALAFVLAAVHAGARGWPQEWGPVLATGAFTGSVYAIAFLTVIRSMAQRGLAMTMAFANLAMVVPVLLAVVWGDRPGAAQGVGFVLAAAAVPMLSMCTARGEAIHERPTLRAALALFVLQGMAMSGNLVAFRTLPAASRPGYLVVLFGAATVVSFLGWRLRRPVPRGDWGRGATFGVLNLTTTLLVLTALSHATATVFFASFSVLGLLLSTAVGVTLWRERVQRWGWAAFALAAGATVLLNL